MRYDVITFRYKGEGAIRNVDEVRRLCAATGFVPGHRKPAGYPKELFDRFPVSTNIVAMVLDQLRSEDMYVLSPSLWTTQAAYPYSR